MTIAIKIIITGKRDAIISQSNRTNNVFIYSHYQTPYFIFYFLIFNFWGFLVFFDYYEILFFTIQLLLFYQRLSVKSWYYCTKILFLQKYFLIFLSVFIFVPLFSRPFLKLYQLFLLLFASASLNFFLFQTKPIPSKRHLVYVNEPLCVRISRNILLPIFRNRENNQNPDRYLQ